MSGDRDIRLSFDEVANVYGRARPSYPIEHFNTLFAALPDQPRILEMGPGTGQATAALLERGAHVTAVEFGPRLAAVLADKFATAHGLSVVNSTFEDADVALASFDAIVAATAYHWVSPDAQVQRPLELLRPGGVLAVIDLLQVDSRIDRGYFHAVQSIYDRYNGPTEWISRSYENALPPIATRLQDSGRYESVQVHRVRWDQTYTAAEYRDLLWSYSGTQMKPEPQRTAMVDELVAVIDHDFGGSITRPLCAALTLAIPGVSLLTNG